MTSWYFTSARYLPCPECDIINNLNKTNYNFYSRSVCMVCCGSNQRQFCKSSMSIAIKKFLNYRFNKWLWIMTFNFKHPLRPLRYRSICPNSQFGTILCMSWANWWCMLTYNHIYVFLWKQNQVKHIVPSPVFPCSPIFADNIEMPLTSRFHSWPIQDVNNDVSCQQTDHETKSRVIE